MDNQIKKLVEKYPNDQELGEAVRQLYWKQKQNKLSNITTENKAMWNTTTSWDPETTITWDEALEMYNNK